jgi:hypothetical protein
VRALLSLWSGCLGGEHVLLDAMGDHASYHPDCPARRLVMVAGHAQQEVCVLSAERRECGLVDAGDSAGTSMPGESTALAVMWMSGAVSTCCSILWVITSRAIGLPGSPVGRGGRACAARDSCAVGEYAGMGLLVGNTSGSVDAEGERCSRCGVDVWGREHLLLDATGDHVTYHRTVRLAG